MPIKSDKIRYGFPVPYDREKTEELLSDLYCALDLKRMPVGVKLYFDQEEYDSLAWPEAEPRLAYCCIVEKATRGQKYKSTLERSCCDGGTTALHVEPSTQRIESGLEYFSYNLYHTPAAARRVREGVPGLYRTGAKTLGIAAGPVNTFETAPDVVLFIVNPYQAMRLQQGYVYHEGGRIEISGASMQAICAEATVEPYLAGRLNATPMCPSTRFLAKWKDEEMAIGVPFERFASMTEGVVATISTTDIVRRKEEIKERFGLKGQQLEMK